MRLYCCLCGRPMDQAAVLIGAMPVGPKCAQRAGLMPLAKRKAGLVLPVVRYRTERAKYPHTGDLFEEAAA